MIHTDYGEKGCETMNPDSLWKLEKAKNLTKPLRGTHFNQHLDSGFLKSRTVRK